MAATSVSECCVSVSEFLSASPRRCPARRPSHRRPRCGPSAPTNCVAGQGKAVKGQPFEQQPPPHHHRRQPFEQQPTPHHHQRQHFEQQPTHITTNDSLLSSNQPHITTNAKHDAPSNDDSSFHRRNTETRAQGVPRGLFFWSHVAVTSSGTGLVGGTKHV